MSKFKIGDKVRTVKAYGRSLPEVGEVISASPNSVLVYFPGWGSGHSKDNCCWNIPNTSEYLELIDMKFAPGDRVIRTNCGNGGYAQVGQEATVVFFEASHDMVYVTYPGHCNEKHGGEGWVTYNTKRLEASDSSVTYEFKPGDRVRVLRTAKTHENGWDNSWVPSMDDAVGKEFEVTRVSTTGVHFKHRFEGFPPFVLELVNAETTPLTTKVYKDPPMLTIESRTFINGADAKDYSDDMLIKKISETEAEIAKLKTIETKSKKIVDRIAQLEAGAKQLAEILDAHQ